VSARPVTFYDGPRRFDYARDRPTAEEVRLWRGTKSYHDAVFGGPGVTLSTVALKLSAYTFENWPRLRCSSATTRCCRCNRWYCRGCYRLCPCCPKPNAPKTTGGCDAG